MISTNVPETLVSGAPVVQSLPTMLFLLSKCCLCTALYTVKTKGPCVLPCHITINLYDIFLTGDSCRHFWTLVVVSFGWFTEYIAPQNFHFIQPHSHNFMYPRALPDGCLNILARNFSWPCGCWPQSWPAPKPLKKSTRFRDVKKSHAQSQTFLSQAVLFVSLSSHTKHKEPISQLFAKIFFVGAAYQCKGEKVLSVSLRSQSAPLFTQKHQRARGQPLPSVLIYFPLATPSVLPRCTPLKCVRGWRCIRHNPLCVKMSRRSGVDSFPTGKGPGKAVRVLVCVLVVID